MRGDLKSILHAALNETSGGWGKAAPDDSILKIGVVAAMPRSATTGASPAGKVLWKRPTAPRPALPQPPILSNRFATGSIPHAGKLYPTGISGTNKRVSGRKSATSREDFANDADNTHRGDFRICDGSDICRSWAGGMAYGFGTARAGNWGNSCGGYLVCRHERLLYSQRRFCALPHGE